VTEKTPFEADLGYAPRALQPVLIAMPSKTLALLVIYATLMDAEMFLNERTGKGNSNYTKKTEVPKTTEKEQVEQTIDKYSPEGLEKLKERAKGKPCRFGDGCRRHKEKPGSYWWKH
jgi:hypothetical protein